MLRLQRSLGQSLVIRDGRDLVTVKLTHLRGGKATLTIRTTHAQNEAVDFTVGGKTVHMQIGEVKAGTAALAIEAPRGVDIVREELIEQRRLTRAAATEAGIAVSIKLTQIRHGRATLALCATCGSELEGDRAFVVGVARGVAEEFLEQQRAPRNRRLVATVREPVPALCQTAVSSPR